MSEARFKIDDDGPEMVCFEVFAEENTALEIEYREDLAIRLAGDLKQTEEIYVCPYGHFILPVTGQSPQKAPTCGDSECDRDCLRVTHIQVKE